LKNGPLHGEKRSNNTHKSTTDPEALLSKKGSGQEAKLNYAGHLLMENRNGLVVDARGESDAARCAKANS
jgi:hypothetical protein